MSSIPYVMPPNNAIANLCSQDQPESVRRAVFEAGLRLELGDYSNTPDGQGVVKGWGTRGQRRR